MQIGNTLEVPWADFDVEQFRRGLEVEQEHAFVTNGDMIAIALIALDHLAEIPDYYTRLDRMERAYKDEQRKRG